MSDPYVYEVGTVDDIDGAPLRVGVDYDTVSIGNRDYVHRLTIEQCEKFAQLFIAACWSAGANSRKIIEDAREASPETEAALGALIEKLRHG